jgi:hypothetical protein
VSPVPDTEGERFPISPRYEFGADEWFGLDANPEGTINVPFEDHYLPYPDWTGFENDHDALPPLERHPPSWPAKPRLL